MGLKHGAVSDFRGFLFEYRSQTERIREILCRLHSGKTNARHSSRQHTTKYSCVVPERGFKEGGGAEKEGHKLMHTYLEVFPVSENGDSSEHLVVKLKLDTNINVHWEMFFSLGTGCSEVEMSPLLLLHIVNYDY